MTDHERFLVNLNRLRQDREADRRLAYRLINAGYAKMRAAPYPIEVTSRLDRARTELKRIIRGL